MKKYLFSFIALLFATTLFSQTIKIENGLTYSSMHSSKFDMLNEKIINYSFLVGYDYLEHKRYYFSSEIGYTSKGGKETNVTYQNTVIDIKDSWDYIHLNTTMRLKHQANNSHIFIGLGPKLDALVGSDKFSDVFFSDGYKMNRFSFGCKAEIGIVQDLNKIRVGLNYSYMANIGEVGKSQYNKVYNRTSTILFSVGFKLN